MKTLAMVLLLCSFLTAFWAILGLIRPKLVLWWALPEKQTRGHATVFALWITGALFFGVYCLAPISPWWAWGIFAIFAFFLIAYQGILSGVNVRNANEGNASSPDDTVFDSPTSYLLKTGKRTKVPSWKSDDLYIVDTQYLTCTCPDWEKTREQYDRLDPRRLCKHLIGQLYLQGIDLKRVYGEAGNKVLNMYGEGRGFPHNFRQGALKNPDWKYEWENELKSFFQKKVPTEDERQMREFFGGDGECLYNFRMYIARYQRGQAVCHVPQEDHYRKRFDVLARTGVAQQGIASLDQVLALLSMDQLKRIAEAVQCQKGRSKQKQSELLLACPEQDVRNVLSSVGIDMNDVFILGALTIE